VDFTQSFLQGVQQGQQRASQKKAQERADEEFDLKKQMLQVEMKKLDIAQKVAARKSAFEEADNMKNVDVQGGMGAGPSTGMPTLDFAAGQMQGPQSSVPVNIPPGGYGEPATTVMAPTRTGIQNTVLDQFNRTEASKKAEFDREQAGRIEVANVTADNRQPSIAALALAAARGDAEAQRAMATLKPAKNSGVADDDADAIADAIIAGDQPPSTAGLYRFAGPVKARLAKKGYNFTGANLDWEATKRHLASLNGVKQTTLRQAASTAYDSLDIIDGLANQWKGGRFPLLNKANLKLAKGGAYGKDAQQIAVQLEGQITDVVSELGQVYMGGNSPTDHALKLAEKNLSADWEQGTLLKMTDLARKNLQVRLNSMNHSVPITTSNSGTPAPSSGGLIVVAAPDGSKHTFPDQAAANRFKQLAGIQ